MGITRKIILYSLFTFGVTVAFLVYLFPSETVTAFLASKVQTLKPGWTLAIESAKPALPYSLALQGVDISIPENISVTADQVKLTPDLLTLFGKNPSVSFSSNLYNGTISGKAVLSKNMTEKPPEVQGTLNAIQLEKIDALKQVSEHSIAGSLNGEFSYAGTGKAGSGESTLTLSQCTISLGQPLFNVNQLTFTGINAKLAFQENQTVLVQDLNGKGPDITGKVSGEIRLKQPMPQSALELTGTITPHPAFLSKLGGGGMAMLFKNKKDGLPFSVRGTVRQPAFSMR